MWKKGDKVVRIYGSNSWGRTGAMRPGDIGTVAEDQKFPGVVALKEFPDGMGHDPIRLRLLRQYKDFTPGELAALWDLVNNQSFESVVTFIKKKLRKR